MLTHSGVIDELLKAQCLINQAESDTCDIMQLPAGARLLKWAYLVKSTWWYQIFSRIDPRFKPPQPVREENK